MIKVGPHFVGRTERSEVPAGLPERRRRLLDPAYTELPRLWSAQRTRRRHRHDVRRVRDVWSRVHFRLRRPHAATASPSSDSGAILYQRVRTSVLAADLTRKLKLVVNHDKSQVCSTKGVEFLGYQFHGFGGQIRVSNKNVQKFQRRAKEITRRNRGVSMSSRLRELATYVRGWVGYFCLDQWKTLFVELDTCCVGESAHATGSGGGEPGRKSASCYRWEFKQKKRSATAAPAKVPGECRAAERYKRVCRTNG